MFLRPATRRTLLLRPFAVSNFSTTRRTMSHHHQTLTEAIREDHQEMYTYYEEYQKAKTSKDVDAQARWARQLIWEVARHAVGEEIVVYPLMEKHIEVQGKQLADQDREDHQFVKERLYEIEKLSPGTEEYDQKLAVVMQHLKPHNESEEQNDLPLLESKIGAEASKKAAGEFSRTKMFVPTRAHPNAPNHPPYETLAGFMAYPMDKMKDMFAKFPTEEMKKKAGVD